MLQVELISGGLEAVQTDVLVLPIFEGGAELDPVASAIDARLDGGISRALSAGHIRAAPPNKVHRLLTFGKLSAEQLILVAAGERSEWSPSRARTVMGSAVRHLRKSGASDAAVALPDAGDTEANLAAMVHGAHLANYSPTQYKTRATGEVDLERLTVLAPDGDKERLMAAAHKAGVIGEAVNLARTLANEPGNKLTPTNFAERAAQVAAACGLGIEVLNEERMQELGYGCILGVAQGSDEPAQLVTLRYDGDPSAPTVALVGKGITFDTGGISIKPSQNMHWMKLDMSGAAAVLGAMQAIATLHPRTNVLGVLCLAENMPGGGALNPGDVVVAGNGLTVEVLNTDAEGRLVLADGLVHALSQGATHLVDVATLTGINRIALGSVATGVYGSSPQWTGRVLSAAEHVGEQMWPMPMYQELRDQLNSDVADLANVGGREGGAIKAAMFIREFTGGAPWVHLDIAGPSMNPTEKSYMAQGATGLAVATLVRLVESMDQEEPTETRT